MSVIAVNAVGACLVAASVNALADNTSTNSSSPVAVTTEYRAGEVIVKLRGSVTGQRISAASAKKFFTRINKQKNLNLIHSWTGTDLHHMRFDTSSGQRIEDVLNALKKDPDVEYAEPNYIVKKSAGEPTLLSASGFGATANQVLSANAQAQNYTLSQVQSIVGQGFGLTQASIQAQPAWALLTAGSGKVVVAVVDTGIDFAHPVFTNAIWTNTREIAANGVDDDGNGYIDDVHGWNFAYQTANPQDDEGHGTHVSGIVIGVGASIFAATPPTPNVQIMPLKFLDSTGSGATSDAISAIYYASNMGAAVMNNSWGGGGYSQALNEAVAYAYNKDVLFVAAAGNSAMDNDTTSDYPANYDVPNVIAVAASDDNDVIASFSNYGTSLVPLSAPGVSILSTYPGGQFARMSGTSMASPFVAGTAALMRYQNPAMNNYQIKQLLLGATDKISGLANYVQTSGRVDVLNSVTSATNTALNAYKPNYLLSLNPLNSSMTSAMSSRGGGCGLVSFVGREGLKGHGRDRLDTPKEVVIMLALLLMPYLLISVLRKPESAASRRRYERYAMNSSVTFKIGDRELVGAVKTISLGGSDLNTEAMLENGSLITMSISSPDGSSKIEVQGHVVWSEEQKRYGVAFDNVAEGVKAQIAHWQKGLSKAA